jgi:hypothetical protein
MWRITLRHLLQVLAYDAARNTETIPKSVAWSTRWGCGWE